MAGKGSGAYITFADGTTDAQAKVAVSYVSAQNAEDNLRAENGPRETFGSVREQAAKTWNKALRTIEVGGGTDAQRSTFYTALYHSMLEPTLTNDVDGRYLGSDRKPHRLAKGQKAQYGTFSGWDQYRAQVQLMTLVNPRAGSDYAQSLYNYARQNDGEWDRWLLGGGKTSVMSGDPSDAALAGIYAFGGHDFDVKGALKSLVTAATVPTANDSDSSGCNVECVGQRPALDKYLELGYVPADGCHCWGGAAETLEDAAADYGLSELSRQTGKTADAKKFLERSGNWSNVFDANATADGGYIRDRKADGTWAGTFTPGTGTGFVEGSSARYTWMVYSDVAGLMRRDGREGLGGKAAGRLLPHPGREVRLHGEGRHPLRPDQRTRHQRSLPVQLPGRAVQDAGDGPRRGGPAVDRHPGRHSRQRRQPAPCRPGTSSPRWACTRRTPAAPTWSSPLRCSRTRWCTPATGRPSRSRRLPPRRPTATSTA